MLLSYTCFLPGLALPQDWVATSDVSSGEWKESVLLVFEYFCERTPRSFVEQRETSVVWNYKYAGERRGGGCVGGVGKGGQMWLLGGSPFHLC